MKLVVLGCGAVGSVIARLAQKLGVASEVACLDKNVERAKSYLSYPDGGDINVEAVDASQVDDLAAKISGFDVVINSLPTFIRVNEKERPLNPLVMQAALKAGVTYVDLACYGGKRRSAEQLSLAKQFRSEGGLALINAGASPGLTNLLAREAYEDFDRADSVKIMSLEDQKGTSFLISWSREEMLNVAIPVLVYKEKRYRVVEPFSEATLCEFPIPTGPVRCYPISNDESYTIPLFLRINRFAYYAGGSDIEILRALYRLGVLEEKNIYVRGRPIPLRSLLYQVLREPASPEDFVRAIEEGELEDAFFAIKVEVEGEVNGEQAYSSRSVIFPSQRKVNEISPGATYISYPTALVALVFARRILGYRISGVYPPEALPRAVRRGILEDLEKNKILVNLDFHVKQR
ncbi:MAG: saccharopine dehydrogenase NADP-binding domain-containing protein [Infirmifilum sp.]